MSPRVHYSPEALRQFDELDTYLTEQAGTRVAAAYLDRLLDFCDRIAVPPVIGHHRDDLLPGLMTRTFEKTRVVCFLLVDDVVHIVAIYGGRQDWEQHLRENASNPPE